MFRLAKISLPAGLVLFFAAAPAAAQFSSDRPDLGDAAYVMEDGVWQLEAGLQLAGNGGIDLLSLGQGVLRYGVGGVELRVHANSLVIDRRSGDTDTGLEDLGLGLKAPLASGGSWQWAVIGTVTLPTGSDPFTADDPSGAIALLGESAVSESVGLSVNVGYGSVFEDLGDGTFTVTLASSLALEDAGASLYAGYAGFFGPSDADAHILETGLVKALGEDLQWDLSGGYDVEAETWFLGIGGSRRWR